MRAEHNYGPSSVTYVMEDGARVSAVVQTGPRNMQLQTALCCTYNVIFVTHFLNQT
jgi:hypothetical protein